MVRDGLLHAFSDNLFAVGGLVIMEILKLKLWDISLRNAELA